MNTFEVHSLLAGDYSTCGAEIKISILHLDCFGCGVFSRRLFGAGEIVGYYYGISVSSKLTTKKLDRKTYNDGIMSVTVDYSST